MVYGRRWFPYLPALVILLTITSCGAPQAIDADKLNTCPSDLSVHTKIVTEGYFGVHRKENLVMCDKFQDQVFCLISFASQPDGESNLSVSVDVGTNPNQLESFTDIKGTNTLDSKDREALSTKLKFHTNDGKVIGMSDKVRITADYTGSCSLEVEKIELAQ